MRCTFSDEAIIQPTNGRILMCGSYTMVKSAVDCEETGGLRKDGKSAVHSKEAKEKIRDSAVCVTELTRWNG